MQDANPKKIVAILYMLLLIALLPFLAIAVDQFSSLPFSELSKKKILSGETIVQSIVTGDSKNQNMDFMAGVYHPRSCTFALRKLSRYENFKDNIDYVKESFYDQKTGRVYFFLSAKFMPISFIVDFKLERIDHPGTYRFVFDKGFLKDLQGEINVFEHGGRCMIYGTAKWSGPHTGFSNAILEVVSSTLAQIGINSLVRISSVY